MRKHLSWNDHYYYYYYLFGWTLKKRSEVDYRQQGTCYHLAAEKIKERNRPWALAKGVSELRWKRESFFCTTIMAIISLTSKWSGIDKQRMIRDILLDLQSSNLVCWCGLFVDILGKVHLSRFIYEIPIRLSNFPLHWSGFVGSRGIHERRIGIWELKVEILVAFDKLKALLITGGDELCNLGRT